jgi:DnaK suppressor protein
MRMDEAYGEMSERGGGQISSTAAQPRNTLATSLQAGRLMASKRRSSWSSSTSHLRAISARLVRLRGELRAELDHCAGELGSGDGNVLDDDDASTRVSQSMCTKTMQHLSERLREVDQALKRLDCGEYGFCEDCGAPVPTARLRANPLARMCLPCQERLERSRLRWRR